MFYDRKIKYLEDRVDGERIRTAGFVKAEVRGSVCRMEIHVSGLHRTDTFEKAVIVVGAGREGTLCKIKIVEGKGDTGGLCFQGSQLGGTGLSYEEMEEIRIPLAAGRELRCLWREKAQGRLGKAKNAVQGAEQSAGQPSSPEQLSSAEQPSNPAQVNSLAPSVSALNGLPEHAEAAALPEVKNIVQSAEQPDGQKRSNGTSNGLPEHAGEAAKPEAQQAFDAARADAVQSPEQSPEQSGPRPPLENKWEQLWAIYPHIAPFQDERDYLSVGPEDFVILPAKYYQLVNNSFLLHGYHNYSHLILTRIVHRGEIRYYVGVPGNYYEKEKQVAIMFGFESFECKTEPVRQGDYGYYMMRVEL